LFAIASRPRRCVNDIADPRGSNRKNGETGVKRRRSLNYNAAMGDFRFDEHAETAAR
jgi:hypothetical protein